MANSVDPDQTNRSGQSIKVLMVNTFFFDNHMLSFILRHYNG